MLHDDPGRAGGSETGPGSPGPRTHRTVRDPLRFAELWFAAQCDDTLGEGTGFWIEAVDGPAWRTALLALPNHEGWQLASDDALITVEESVFLADNKGPRKSLQVVLNRTLDDGTTEVGWSLERSRTKVLSPSDLDTSEAAPDELPLG